MKSPFPLYPRNFPPFLGSVVQTRSEETGIQQHPDLKTAVNHALEDETVWKISYQSEDGWVRIVIR